MFIQIDEMTTINTDHIVRAETGGHEEKNVTKLYMSDGEVIELPFVHAKALWKAVKRQDIDKPGKPAKFYSV